MFSVVDMYQIIDNKNISLILVANYYRCENIDIIISFLDNEIQKQKNKIILITLQSQIYIKSHKVSPLLHAAYESYLNVRQ